jgi:hypothetical protein
VNGEGLTAGAHGLPAQVADTVVTELVTPSMRLLTTETEQVISVVAPPGAPGAMLSHWDREMSAACAEGVRSARPVTDTPTVRMASSTTSVRHRCRQLAVQAAEIWAVIGHDLPELSSKRWPRTSEDQSTLAGVPTLSWGRYTDRDRWVASICSVVHSLISDLLSS